MVTQHTGPQSHAERVRKAVKNAAEEWTLSEIDAQGAANAREALVADLGKEEGLAEFGKLSKHVSQERARKQRRQDDGQEVG